MCCGSVQADYAINVRTVAIGNTDLIRQVTSLLNASPPVIIILPSRLTTKILSVVHWITNIVTTAATVAAKLLKAYNTQRLWKEGRW